VDEKVEAYIFEKRLYEIENANKALALETPKRQAHSVRVAQLAAKRALGLKIPEKKAITAALFHDCGKNLSPDSPYLEGFTLPQEWGEVPASVYHQFAGAYVAEKHFGIKDEDVLNAIRYHTSGRPNMSELEKLIFLADMLEEERSYEGVEVLRKLFWRGQGLDECLEEALFQTLEFLKLKQAEIYPLTKKAYEFYKKGV
jgi:predicted HD superfamily hydrolase involved in NAD metabolism